MDTFHRMRIPISPRPLLAAALTLALLSCERGFPTAEDRPAISEDAFVAAMAELRHAGVDWEEGHVPADERDRILRELGLEAGELVEFVEIHGRNVPFMFRVWTRVDSAVIEKGARLDEDPFADSDDAAAEPGPS